MRDDDLTAPVPDRYQPRAANGDLPPRPWTWRTGRTIGTTLYVQVPGGDRKQDVYAGIMDTPELAGMAARRMNDATTQPGALADSLSALTDRLWANKQAKGFNTTDVPVEFCLLTAEVGEAIDAWRHGSDVGAELADVLLFTLSLARMLEVDLGAEAEAKMAVNEERQYVRQPNGLHVQVEDT